MVSALPDFSSKLMNTTTMAFDTNQLSKPFRKLRKELRRVGKHPEAEQVHQLRTHARRVEAVIEAVEQNPDSNERELLRLLERIRKGAGKVRDMDVFIAQLAHLDLPSGEDNCQVELLEYLSGKRLRNARKLYRMVEENGPELRRRLKRCNSKILKLVEQAESSTVDEPNAATIHAVADALQVSADLAKAEILRNDSLHDYRLGVKRLQYVLQLADQSHKDEQFIEQLKQVKDSIGKWHDWQVLSGIAGKLLKAHHSCRLVRVIKATAAEKLEAAVDLAGRMREQYLQSKSSSRRGKARGKAPLAAAAVSAASTLVA